MHHQKRQSSSRTTSHSRAPASSKCRSKQQSRTAQQWSTDSRPEEVGDRRRTPQPASQQQRKRLQPEQMEAGRSVHDRRRRRCQAAPGASWTGGGRPRRARQTPAMDGRRTGGWRSADGADGSRADGADGLRVTGTARTATNRRQDELQRAAAADGRDGRRTSGRCGWPRRAADGRPAGVTAATGGRQRKKWI